MKKTFLLSIVLSILVFASFGSAALFRDHCFSLTNGLTCINGSTGVNILTGTYLDYSWLLNTPNGTGGGSGVNTLTASNAGILVINGSVSSVGLNTSYTDLLYASLTNFNNLNTRENSNNQSQELRIQSINTTTNIQNLGFYTNVQTNTTIDAKIAVIAYKPTQVTTLYGTNTSGNASSMGFVDNLIYNISEAGGANALEVYINFTNVTTNLTGIQYYLKYVGTSGDEIIFEIFDNVTNTWEQHGQTIGSSVDFVGYNVALFDASEHIINNTVQTRFRHLGKGSVGDFLSIDYINLIKGPFVTGQSGSIDPRYLFVDGSNTMNQNLTFSDSYGVNASYVLSPPWANNVTTTSDNNTQELRIQSVNTSQNVFDRLVGMLTNKSLNLTNSGTAGQVLSLAANGQFTWANDQTGGGGGNVSGGGVANFIPKWVNQTFLTSSNVLDDGNGLNVSEDLNVGIGPNTFSVFNSSNLVQITTSLYYFNFSGDIFIFGVNVSGRQSSDNNTLGFAIANLNTTEIADNKTQDALISTAQSTANGKASPGNCPVGQAVNMTTTSGVVCTPILSSVGYQSSAVGASNNTYMMTTNLWFNATGNLSFDSGTTTFNSLTNVWKTSDTWNFTGLVTTNNQTVIGNENTTGTQWASNFVLADGTNLKQLDLGEQYSVAQQDYWYNNINAWAPFYGGNDGSGNTGTSSSVAGDAYHMGVVAFNCVALGNKSGIESVTLGGGLRLQGGEQYTAIFQFKAQVANMSTAPNWTRGWFGFHDGTGGSPETQDGVVFIQDNSTIRGYVYNNSVISTNTSAFTLLDSIWYKLFINITNLTTAQFYIYNSTLGNTNLLFEQNVSGAIPNLIGRETAAGIRIINNGSCQLTSVLDNVDYQNVNINRFLAR